LEHNGPIQYISQVQHLQDAANVHGFVTILET